MRGAHAPRDVRPGRGRGPRQPAQVRPVGVQLPGHDGDGLHEHGHALGHHGPVDQVDDSTSGGDLSIHTSWITRNCNEILSFLLRDIFL